MKSFSDKAVSFFMNLTPPEVLSENISAMNPYASAEVQNLIKIFYEKYFDDKNERVFIIGINPGRFGGGLTGIAFTDPAVLEDKLNIKNSFIKKRELSSEFIYSVIDEFGGAGKFYKRFFLSAVYPLALIKDGKNFNYYDDKKVFGGLKPAITESLTKQIKFGAKKNYVISLGKKNAEYLSALNNEIKYFDKILTLEHPRYIMQYKRKYLNEYIRQYLSLLNSL